MNESHLAQAAKERTSILHCQLGCFLLEAFLALLVALRDEPLPSIQAQFPFSVCGISADSRLANREVGMFCSQARPDPVRRVPLFTWHLQIELQYLLDLIPDWSESRLPLARQLLHLDEMRRSIVDHLRPGRGDQALVSCKTGALRRSANEDIESISDEKNRNGQGWKDAGSGTTRCEGSNGRNGREA